MTQRSVDALQAALAEEVFSHTRDARKSAGRALGTRHLSRIMAESKKETTN